MFDFHPLFRWDGQLLPLRKIANLGLARLEAEVRKRTDYAYLGEGLGLCRVLGRYKMYVDPQDVGHSSHLILEGAWELWVTRFLASRVRSGMVVADVGSNLGYFTLLMADLVGASGRVLAFEPNTAIADRLEKSIIVNGFGQRAQLRRVAVGADDGASVKLVVPDNLPSGAWLVPSGAIEQGVSVPVCRLDSLAELARADVVKIDAEGYEYEVWRGMGAIIAQGHPMLILMEFALARYAKSPEFLSEIAAARFEISVIEQTGQLRRVSREEILSWSPDRDEMLVLERK